MGWITEWIKPSNSRIAGLDGANLANDFIDIYGTETQKRIQI